MYTAHFWDIDNIPITLLSILRIKYSISFNICTADTHSHIILCMQINNYGV